MLDSCGVQRAVFSKELIEVADAGNYVLAAALIKLGADINATNNQGDTALHLSAANGSTRIVNLLLSNGADVNAKNALSHTPLHTAANGKNASTVKALLKAGADVNAQTFLKSTPRDIAILLAQTEIIKLFDDAVTKKQQVGKFTAAYTNQNDKIFREQKGRG